MRWITFILLIAISPATIGQTAALPTLDGVLLPDASWLPLGAVEDYVPSATPLPPSADNSKWFPSAGNQHQQYSCMAWSWAYGVHSYLQNRLDGRTYTRTDPIDTVYSYSPSYIFNLYKQLVDPTSTCTTGVDSERFMVFGGITGVCTLEHMPYDPAVDGCKTQVPATAMGQAGHRVFKPPFTSSVMLGRQNVEQWKQHLAIGEPLLMLLNVDDLSFRDAGYTASRDSVPFIWNIEQVDNYSFGNHAVVCTGYNDSDSTFTFMNSWGKNWGDTGYFKARKYALINKCSGAYAFPLDTVQGTGSVQKTIPEFTGNGTLKNQKLKPGEYVELNGSLVRYRSYSSKKGRAVIEITSQEKKDDPTQVYQLTDRSPISIYKKDQRMEITFKRGHGDPKRRASKNVLIIRSGSSEGDPFLKDQRDHYEKIRAALR